jgi:purine nucleoside permease
MTVRRLPLVLVAAAAVCAASPVRSDPVQALRQVKVLVVTPTSAEAQPFVDKLALTDEVKAPGIPDAMRCNADDVCLVVTGAGKAAAAASVAAATFAADLDLSKAYVILAGVAAIDPTQGTIGSAAWAKNVVDYGIAWELDARAVPAGWDSGYLGIFASSPTDKPHTSYGSEMYALDADLANKALALSSAAPLADDDGAKATRAHYAGPPATAAPHVLACDTTTSDTAWHGELLGKRAHAWVALMTDGAGTYCTAQQNDNGAMAALTRGAEAGLVNAKRIAVVHAASRFDRQYAGQAAHDSLMTAEASAVAIGNLYTAAAALVKDVVQKWPAYSVGVPK